MKKSFFVLFALLVLFVGGIFTNQLLHNQKEDKNNQGEVIGFIELYNEFGTNLDSASGVNISADSTSNSSTSNRDGKFTLTDINRGPLNLRFKKAGFPDLAYHLQSVFTGGDAPFYIEKLIYSQKSTTSITGLNINMAIDSSNIIISGQISPAGTQAQARCVVIFASLSPYVSSSKYDFAIVKSNSIYNPIRYNWYNDSTSNLTSTNNTFSTGNISLKKYFKQGDKVYFKAYGNSYFYNDSLDTNTGDYVITTVNVAGASKVDSLIIR